MIRAGCFVLAAAVLGAARLESAFAGDADRTLIPPLEAKLDGLEGDRKSSRWAIRPYKANYLLLYTYSTDPNQTTVPDPEKEWDKGEIKFQISFLLPLARDIPYLSADLLFGYTQLSFWQAYNRDQSSPFRTTNYEPEMLLHFDTDVDIGGLTNRAVELGYVTTSISPKIGVRWN